MLIAHNVKAEATRIVCIVMAQVIPSVVYVLDEDIWYVRYAMAMELLSKVVVNVKEKVKYIRLAMNVTAKGTLENLFDTL